MSHDNLPSALTKPLVSVVVGFYCNRLEDEDSIREVVDGLTALVGMSAFSSTNVDEILAGYVIRVIDRYDLTVVG